MATYLDVFLEKQLFTAVLSTVDVQSCVPTHVWRKLGSPRPSYVNRDVFIVPLKMCIGSCKPFVYDFHVYNKLKNVIIGTNVAQALNSKLDLRSGTMEVEDIFNTKVPVLLGPKRPLKVCTFKTPVRSDVFPFGNSEINLNQSAKRNLEFYTQDEEILRNKPKRAKYDSTKYSVSHKKYDHNVTSIVCKDPPKMQHVNIDESSLELPSSWDEDPNIDISYVDGVPTISSPYKNNSGKL